MIGDNPNSELRNFFITCGKNSLVFFAAPTIIILFVFFIFNFPRNIEIGIIFILLANLFVYLLTAALYYWKSTKAQLNDIAVRSYFIRKKVSLRPWTGYTEIFLLTFFFLVHPEIIVGYLILRGVVGYRRTDYKESHKNEEDDLKKLESAHPTEDTGELNSIKAIGLVLNIFIAVIAAAVFYNSPAKLVLDNYFGWLINSR